MNSGDATTSPFYFAGFYAKQEALFRLRCQHSKMEGPLLQQRPKRSDVENRN
jgi:hypothetical protein